MTSTTSTRRSSTSEWNVDVTTVGKIKYDVCKDNVEINEKLYWLQRPEDYVVPSYDLNTLVSWRKMSPNNKINLTEDSSSSSFVNTDLFIQLYEQKTALREHSMENVQNARLRSNAFENIKEGGIFINRAAMKMANLDAILNFQLTDPNSATAPNERPLVDKTEPLYFADVCAGPGGFSEYFLWRKRFKCLGFGLTLKGDHDFNLSGFVTGTDNFTAYYGEAGDGNINNPLNVNSLIKFVYENTDHKGVHIVTADGGIDFGGQEEYQEIVTKQILLAQALVGVSLLRPGGHFICKTFDLFTRFSVGLIYLLSICFKKFCIHKPNTSRPANSERYLICQYKHQNTANIQAYLKNCHELLWRNKSLGENGGSDILELVQFEVVKNDSKFFEYVSSSNNRLAIRQILGLQKLLAYAEDISLFDPRQNQLRQQSLEVWRVQSDKTPEGSGVKFPKDRFQQIKGNCSLEILSKPEFEMSSAAILDRIKSPFDWRVVIVGGSLRRRGHYFGFGGGRNYFLDHNVWREGQVKFNLPKDTIVYGEIVDELLPHAREKSGAFHIIDAMILSGEDIRNLHFNERHALCQVFVRTLGKPAIDMIPIRTKRFIKMENLGEYYASLTRREGLARELSNGVYSEGSTTDTRVSIKPIGLLFLKITADPWMMAFCKRAASKYWFHTIEKSSTFSLPPKAVADFNCTASNRMIWIFGHSEDEQRTKKDRPKISELRREDVDKHIQSLLRTITTA